MSNQPLSSLDSLFFSRGCNEDHRSLWRRTTAQVARNLQNRSHTRRIVVSTVIDRVTANRFADTQMIVVRSDHDNLIPKNRIRSAKHAEDVASEFGNDLEVAVGVNRN